MRLASATRARGGAVSYKRFTILILLSLLSLFVLSQLFRNANNQTQPKKGGQRPPHGHQQQNLDSVTGNPEQEGSEAGSNRGTIQRWRDWLHQQGFWQQRPLAASSEGTSEDNNDASCVRRKNGEGGAAGGDLLRLIEFEMGEDEERNLVAEGGGGGGATPHSHVQSHNEEADFEVFDGVRHFRDSCVTQGDDRLEFLPKEKALKRVQGRTDVRVEYIDSVAFMVRDVCALGHFPKDLTHFVSYQLLHTEEDVGDLIIGNRCITKDKSDTKGGNKRTPVWHNALIHWVRAISGHWMFLHNTSSPSAAAASHGSSDVGAVPFVKNVLTFSDFLDLKRKGHEEEGAESIEEKTAVLRCYRHVVEREEKWRWFPSHGTASEFRRRMWHYLSLNYTEALDTYHNVPFAKQRRLQVVVLRRDEDRHFGEKKAVEFLQEKFGRVAEVRFEQYDDPPPSKRKGNPSVSTISDHVAQLRQLFSTDVLITAHGAALSNIVVMKPGAVVVELFPHNFRYYMYEELSRILSLEYTAYESPVVTPANCCKFQRSWSLGGGKGEGGGAKKGDEGEEDELLEGAADLKARTAFQVALNGKRDCKKCDVTVSETAWYQMMKNSLMTVWLRNSRMSNVHDFDVRH